MILVSEKQQTGCSLLFSPFAVSLSASLGIDYAVNVCDHEFRRRLTIGTKSPKKAPQTVCCLGRALQFQEARRLSFQAQALVPETVDLLHANTMRQ